MNTPPKDPVLLGPLMSVEELPDDGYWKHKLAMISFFLAIAYVGYVAITTPRHYITPETTQSAKE